MDRENGSGSKRPHPNSSEANKRRRVLEEENPIPEIQLRSSDTPFPSTAVPSTAGNSQRVNKGSISFLLNEEPIPSFSLPSHGGMAGPSSGISPWTRMTVSGKELSSRREMTGQRSGLPSQLEGTGRRSGCPSAIASISQDTNEHIPQNRRGSKYSCRSCEYETTQPSFLKRHEVSHLPYESRRFACETCGVRFARKVGLVQHKVIHDRNRERFRCDKCNETFVQKKNLLYHIRRAHPQSKYTCHQCQKSFLQEQQLESHKLMHHSSGFACDHCGKAFSERRFLYNHMRLHDLQKSYPCDQCMKSFPERHLLESHKSCHDLHNRPSFPCEQCGKSFATNGNMRRHRRDSCKHRSNTPGS